MTQPNSHLHHRRTPSSNGSKLKTSRPAFHRKGTSSVNHSISKLGSGQARRSVSGPDDDCQLDMAASFLNFCAMCERQITVPDNSLLYCSESCRRKDSHKPLSASFPSTVSMSYSTTPPTSPPMSPRMIVAPMTPTKVPAKSTSAIQIPTDLQDSNVDLDPSEWKPVIPTGHGNTGSPASCEAWHYLSQFHSHEATCPRHHYGAGHSSSSLSTLMSATAAPPPLTHTPSTSASSFSSNASNYMSYVPDASHRPLPPRHNPYFSNAVTKGVELVVPQMDAPVVVTTVNMSDGGSIFPASSSLWNDTVEKVPTAKWT